MKNSGESRQLIDTSKLIHQKQFMRQALSAIKQEVYLYKVAGYFKLSQYTDEYGNVQVTMMKSGLKYGDR